MIKITNIQAKLSEAIKQSGLTQTEIAKRIGVSQSAIAHYIKGDIIPSLDTFASLCEILDLDSNDILCIKQSESDRIRLSQPKTKKLSDAIKKVKPSLTIKDNA